MEKCISIYMIFWIIFRLTMLINHVDCSTMGFLVEKEGSETNGIVEEYEPAVMWNLRVNR